MQLLSDDDLDLAGMTDEELDAAWDLWFDLAQSTNAADPLWTHGVFLLCEEHLRAEAGEGSEGDGCDLPRQPR